MGILIIIVIATIVIAGVGAGIYVVVFRAKHKKEVLANAQMGGNVPVYGPTPDQQPPAQPQGLPDSGIGQPQAGQPANPLMNDITGAGSQGGSGLGMPQQTPEPPQALAPDSTGGQPAVNHSFPGTSPEPEVTTSDAGTLTGEPPMPTEMPSPGGAGSDVNMSGTLLDDDGMVNPVAEPPASPDTTVDSSMGDSAVPITTEENASLEQAGSGLGAAPEPAAQSVGGAMPQTPEPVSTAPTAPPSNDLPETPAAPAAPPQSTVADFPQTTESNNNPTTDGEQNPGTKEMNI